jgi:hypothetical protein
VEALLALLEPVAIMVLELELVDVGLDPPLVEIELFHQFLVQ